MAKNDVEMVIRAKDETGNGIDSARKKFGELQKTIGGGSGSGGNSLVNTTIKLGAAVGALDGGFKLAAAGVALFQGDAEAVKQALQGLPLGIGGVVSAFNMLDDALSASRKRAEAFRSAWADVQDELFGEKVRVGMIGASGPVAAIAKINEQERLEVQKLEKKNREEYESERKSLGTREASDLFFARKQRIDIIKEGFEREREVQRQAAQDQFESGAKQARDRLAAINKENEEREKLELQAAYKRQEGLANITEMGAAARFGMASDLRNLFAGPESSGIPEIDRSAIEAAMKALRNGGVSQLAGGSQDRFGTGLAASARESTARMARDTADATKESAKKLEDIRKLLEEANKPPAGPGINLEMLEGLT